ncbi:Golgi transport complex subunit 5-domain-containing protein [Cantharellus anzutake]|uniref:Golgi transport complex subunit 5-domain-containing protein n=1 Tax=Cantharellus anzutake TaxID=1750568 RepID=UPI00190887EC|nr:Golgi transport complex subunit 5-domain-containing protein [Cantharellus anzutake]KAF8335774.1 Golgi transport complex subunit 5-domain-containing protein [Cantharellus anzutake]
MSFTPEEYNVFASPSFEAHDYANAVLAGETYKPGKKVTAPNAAQPSAREGTSLSRAAGREDISVALNKLNYGIDDISKQLRAVILNHHEELLDRAAGVGELEESLRVVKQGLNSVNTSLEKLRLKVHVPHENLSNYLSRLQHLQIASDALRRASRFIIFARRLESQISELDRLSSLPTPKTNGTSARPQPKRLLTDDVLFDNQTDKERTIAQAAFNIAEIESLLSASGDSQPNESSDSPPQINLTSINAVSRLLTSIESSRVRIASEMEGMVLSGLDTLNHSLLASSLQAAFNLRVLPTLVQSLLADLNQAIEGRVKATFDVLSLSRETNAKDAGQPAKAYRSRVRTEPTTVTAAQWTNTLWSRLEGLVEDMAGCCIKVYTLEKVLKAKKDTISQVSFLDDVMQSLESRPSLAFWSSLAVALEKYSKEAASSSSFFQQTLSNGYPRLLRLFHDFFAKIAVHTDTQYTEAHQSPETVLALRSISRFETIYLTRSLSRMNETIAAALAGGTRSPPGYGEGLGIGRVIATELDSARFDVLLLRSVVKNAVTALEGFTNRTNSLVSRDRMATLLTGPNATPQQLLNAQLASAFFGCWKRLMELEAEYPAGIFNVLSTVVKNIRVSFDKTVDPLLSAIRREFSSIIARLHRVDFGDRNAALGGGGGTSIYMKDLIEKLEFVRAAILARHSVGEFSKEWSVNLIKYVIRTFVLHASLARPLGENGKLQMTSDMTEFEFALSAFLVADESTSPAKARNRNSMMKRAVTKLDSIGDEYKALRAMRPLLFLETPLLASPASTSGLPVVVVLHHIIVRSSAPALPLPNALHEWSHTEYVKWLEEHGETGQLKLVDGCIPQWEEQIKSAKGGDLLATVASETSGDGDIDYLLLIRTVVDLARER